MSTTGEWGCGRQAAEPPAAVSAPAATAPTASSHPTAAAPTAVVPLANTTTKSTASSPSPSGALEFIGQSFADLYPVFLTRKVKPGPKAALWREYYGRWVRWDGIVRSFTANGITLKQLPQTVTFDVSLWIEGAQRGDLRKRIHVGDLVSYVGRLDSYDDVFRTLYLVHGAIIADLGKPPPDWGKPPDSN
jgi:hypothetical protein